MFSSRVRASLCFAAILAGLVSACTGDARRDALRPASPVVVRIGTFVPKLSSSPTMNLAGLFSGEPLVAVEWNGRPVNRLADSVVESDNGMLLTVTLKPDIRFHSNEVVTAARVRDLLLPKVIKLAGQEVKDVAALGDTQLVFHLHRPYALQPVDLSAFVVDSDKQLDLRTGPFKIVSTGPPLVLEPYAQYAQGSPAAVTRIEIREYPTHRAAWSAMLRGEVNFLHEVNRDAIDFIETGGQITAYPLLRPFLSALVFNQRHPVLGRRDVRVALNESINREEVVSNGMRGHGEVAEGPFWPHHWAYPHGRVAVSHNPEAARVRLDAAGLRVRSRNLNEMPSRFSFTCLLPLGDSRFERMALVVQRQLSAVGVDMRLEPVPVQQFYPRAAKGDFEALISEMSTGRTLKVPYDFWHSKGAIAFSGYSAADAALDRMRLARTDDEVQLAVLDVMRVLRSDPPAIFLTIPREVRAADKSFDIPYETDHDVFYTLWKARPRTDQAVRR
jgi:peptide/nickel transport system substrate-binding protein